MKKGAFETIGNLIFDYMVLTVLFAGSLALVIPLLPLIAGFQNYVECDVHSRKLSMIFEHIKGHLGIISLWTVWIIIIVGISLMNILWLKTPFPLMDSLISVISYIVLWISITFVIHGPTLIKNMDLTFSQLIRNSMMLILGNPVHYLLSIGLMVILLYIGIHSIIAFILGLALVLYAVARLSWINFTQTKERMK